MQLSFASRQKMQANNNLRGSRQQVVSTLKPPIRCRPDGTRYGPRIPSQKWSKHRPRFEEMHFDKIRREDMLRILEKECRESKCDFHPSLPQLNRKMQKWALSKPCKISETQNSLPQPVGSGIPGSALPSVFPDVYPLVSNHDLPMIQCGSYLPDPEELPDFVSDYDSEDSSINDILVSPILPEDESALVPATSSQPTGPLTHIKDIVPLGEEVAYCEDVCCKTLLQIHKKLLAVSFLAGLKCWREACGYLSKVAAELDCDSSISASDKMWVKLVYNRMKGNIFTPDKTTNIFMGEGLRNVAEPLKKYIEQAESQQLPNALATLCLTTQYRRFGSFEYYLHATNHCDSLREQVRILSTELQIYEVQTNVLRHILFWCKRILADPEFRGTLEMLPQFVEHTDSLREIVLPRLLACRFMSSWIAGSHQTPSEVFALVKPRLGALFVHEVMLPELFVSISRLFLTLLFEHKKELPILSSPVFVDDLLEGLKKAAGKATQMQQEQYCLKVAEALISMCEQTSVNSQADCPYSNCLPPQVAYEIMGTNSLNARGLGRPLTWMRTADVFKVDSRYHATEPIPTMNEPSVDPVALTIMNGKDWVGQFAMDVSTQHDPASYMHIRNKSSSDTIEELLETKYQASIDGLKDCSVDVIMPLKDVRSPAIGRQPTTSTEREFKNVAARAKIGSIIVPDRTSSKKSAGSSSGISWNVNTPIGRYSFIGGHEQLEVGDSAHEVMRMLATIPNERVMDIFDNVPDVRSHAYDIDRDPHVDRWVRAQNAPSNLGRSTSAA